MKFTLNEGATLWEADEHPFDFNGCIETHCVTIHGRGAGRIHELYRSYENDLLGVEAMDDDDLGRPEGRIAAYLSDHCPPTLFKARGKTVLHVHWEDRNQAEQFMSRFAPAVGKAA